jgi:hypothetical protein
MSIEQAKKLAEQNLKKDGILNNTIKTNSFKLFIEEPKLKKQPSKDIPEPTQKPGEKSISKVGDQSKTDDSKKPVEPEVKPSETKPSEPASDQKPQTEFERRNAEMEARKQAQLKLEEDRRKAKEGKLSRNRVTFYSHYL